MIQTVVLGEYGGIPPVFGGYYQKTTQFFDCKSGPQEQEVVKCEGKEGEDIGGLLLRTTSGELALEGAGIFLMFAVGHCKTMGAVKIRAGAEI